MDGGLSSEVLRRIAPIRETLVLVVDVQNDFCSPQGAFHIAGDSSAPIRSMLPTLDSFLKTIRKCDGRLAFVRHEYDAGLLSRRTLARDRLRFASEGFPQPGTWGAEFAPPIAPLAGEALFIKHHYSALTVPSFRDLLRSTGTRTLVLTGILTNVCVESTAREAEALGLNVIVVEDCVASNDVNLHDASLANIALYFGWTCTARALAAVWESPSAMTASSPGRLPQQA